MHQLNKYLNLTAKVGLREVQVLILKTWKHGNQQENKQYHPK